MNRALYLFLILVLTVVTFIARWERFKRTEPRIDQANFAASVRGIVEATHAWPTTHGTESFSQALLADEGSLLYRIGRPIFNNPQSCFNLVPLLISSSVCRLFSYSYEHLVLLSILATCLCLFPLGYLPFAAFRNVNGHPLPLEVMGLCTALVYAITLQVSLFSPWGVHNAGVFFLLVAIAVIVWIVRDVESWEALPVRPICLILLFSAIACYSHWTDVFLLLPTVILSLLTIREISLRRRVAIAAVLTVLLGAILLPVGLLAAMLHRTDNNFLVYMDLGNSPWVLLRGIPVRGLKWFSAGCEMFSPAGLLLGITGLVWIAKRYRISLPLICLAVHFSAYCLIPGFIWNGSPTWLRTYNYVLPLLSIGIGAMLAVAWRGLRTWPVVGRLVVGVLFLLYTDQQIPQLHAAEWLENRSPDFYSNYLAGQGDLRPSVAGLEGAIPEGAQIFFWDYPLRQLYQSLDRSSGRNPIVASTITSTLSMGGKRNRFYESPRTLPVAMYVITPGSVSPGELQNALLVILQTAGMKDVRGISLSAKGRWETSSYGTIVLYDVRWM